MFMMGILWYLQLKETGSHDLDWALQLLLLILLKGVSFSFVAEGDEAKQMTFQVVSHSEVKGGKKLQAMIMSAVNIVSLYRTINKIMKLISKRS